ncbi:MAG TPA: Holliday junction resolvase RuvX [Candidatus Woesebacteria bacterium]|jgi:putative transcription antitermination factor YqgF|nr:Holliday junction resolvase RuvX [Candidatus Shapirobacteria bacterium]HOR01880.1 Holliday junction resolvase RuvX [Candidatus Woesebacteria bacterium]
MNSLAIDYGTKRIGIAISIQGVIQPLTTLKNSPQFFEKLQQIISDYKIDQIYVGISQGAIATQTKKFVNQLQNMLTLPISTVEEAVSTVEADNIFTANKKHRKDYQKTIDAIAAAVILKRVIS